MVQDLVRDPIPDTCAEALVEEQSLDRTLAACHEFFEVGSGGPAEEGIESQFGDGRLVEGVGAEADAAEAAGVHEGELGAVGEVEDELGKLG